MWKKTKLLIMVRKEVDMARLMQVIEVETTRGEGTSSDDPIRMVVQYFSPEGELLAERDTHMDNLVKMVVEYKSAPTIGRGNDEYPVDKLT